MGQLTNPTGFRIGRTLKWPSKWMHDKTVYVKYFFIMKSLYLYINRFFFSLVTLLRKAKFVFSHLRLLFGVRNVIIRIFIFSRDFLKATKRRKLKFYVTR